MLLEEDLARKAAEKGEYLLKHMNALAAKYPKVMKLARGRGLMLGMELVKDRRTKAPLGKDVTQALYKECLRRGLASMTYSPTVRINPPLVLTESEARDGVAILDEVFADVERDGRWKA